MQINASIIGDGPPLVMLHGWGASIALLSPLAERIAPMGYRVHMLDLPGFGQTPAPSTAWTVFDYARFVVDYLDRHQLQRVHLFGHSFGGRLGLILGAEHPDRLYTMTLADAAGIRPPKRGQLRLTLYKGIRDGLKRVGLRGMSESLRRWYNGRYGSADFNAVSGVMRQTFVQVVNQDLQAYAQRVRVPTLLVWGEEDADTPLEQGRQLERLIPDAGLVVYPGAGHYSYLENPIQTAQAMHALMSSVG
jgi:pimeloyl-ACP methyl ester carboxylesterase